MPVRTNAYLSSLVGAVALAATFLSATPAGALAAPLKKPDCVSSSNGTTVVTLVPDANGQPSLSCVPQPGQILLVLAAGPTPTPPAPADDQLGTMADPRIDTYAKRQAIRDQYRGLINETTFNDELADGVGLDQALRDAMNELGSKSR